jgi:hypothetical protein
VSYQEASRSKRRKGVCSVTFRTLEQVCRSPSVDGCAGCQSTQDDQVFEAEVSALAPNIVHEASEPLASGCWQQQFDVGLVCFVSRKVFAKRNRFLVDTIYTQPGPVHESNCLQYVGKKGIAANRRMANDVVYGYATDETARTLYFYPAIKNCEMY